MKKWLWLVALALVVSGCKEEQASSGGEGPQSDNAEEQGVAGQEHAAWGTDLMAAKAQAKKEGKYVLIDFSGSDWCGWCIKLDNEVFSKPEFKDYAAKNLVLVMADFPRDKSGQSAELQEANKKLAEEFSIRGFPTVFLLSPEGESIAQTGYQAGGPKAYVEHIEKLIADAK